MFDILKNNLASFFIEEKYILIKVRLNFRVYFIKFENAMYFYIPSINYLQLVFLTIYGRILISKTDEKKLQTLVFGMIYYIIFIFQILVVKNIIFVLHHIQKISYFFFNLSTFNIHIMLLKKCNVCKPHF